VSGHRKQKEVTCAHLECNIARQHVETGAHGFEGAASAVVEAWIVAKHGQVRCVAAAR